MIDVLSNVWASVSSLLSWVDSWGLFVTVALWLVVSAYRRLACGLHSARWIFALASRDGGRPGFGRASIVAGAVGIVVAGVLVGPASAYIAIGTGLLPNKAIAFLVLFLGTYAILKRRLMVRTWRGRLGREAVAKAKIHSQKRTTTSQGDADSQGDANIDGSAIEAGAAAARGTFEEEHGEDLTNAGVALLMRLLRRRFVAPLAFNVTTVTVGIVVAAILIGPASAHVAIAAESLWNKVIAFLALFLVTYSVLKLPESHMQQIGIHARQAALVTSEHVLLRMYALGLGVVEAAAILAAVIAGMHVQPWLDLSGYLERNALAQLAERVLGIGPTWYMR